MRGLLNCRKVSLSVTCLFRFCRDCGLSERKPTETHYPGVTEGPLDTHARSAIQAGLLTRRTPALGIGCTWHRSQLTTREVMFVKGD